MPSARARSGYSRTSTISSLNLSFRCSLQIAARLATARIELGALFAMYRRITTTVVTARPDAPRFVFLRGNLRILAVLPSGISGTGGGTTLHGGGHDPG